MTPATATAPGPAIPPAGPADVAVLTESHVGPDVLVVLGAARGPAEESTFRRAFALVSADVLDRP